jgi:thiamine pyrophosphokinase
MIPGSDVVAFVDELRRIVADTAVELKLPATINRPSAPSSQETDLYRALAREARAEFPGAEFVATPDQDQADLEKALHVARERGATTITITGAAGGRIDHTLANFSLLLRYHREIPMVIVDDGSDVLALSGMDETPDEQDFAATPGDTFSLLSLDGKAHATIQGVKWPLDDYRLPIGTLGVSNVAEAERVVVWARGGALLVCHLPIAVQTNP